MVDKIYSAQVHLLIKSDYKDTLGQSSEQGVSENNRKTKSLINRRKNMQEIIKMVVIYHKNDIKNPLTLWKERGRPSKRWDE